MTLFEHRFEHLNYAEGPPQGDPFVLLHGGGGRWQNGETFLELLAGEGWHVYAPDLRGHGRSGHVAGAYNLMDYVPDLVGFLERLVATPSVVFGHSLGGEISVMAAAQRPDLFRALIIGDAPLSMQHSATENPGHRAMNVFLHRLAGKPAGEIALALREMPLGPPPQTARDVLGNDHPWYTAHAENTSLLDPDVLAAVLSGPEVMLAGYEPRELLPKITCPVLLLQADPSGPMQAGMLHDDDVALGLSLLPQASHLRLQGIGHPLHSPSSQAPAVLEAIRPFLQSI